MNKVDKIPTKKKMFIVYAFMMMGMMKTCNISKHIHYVNKIDLGSRITRTHTHILLALGIFFFSFELRLFLFVSLTV